MSVREGDLLWRPSEAFADSSNLRRFQRWLEAEEGLSFADYPALHSWSVAELDRFWAALWRFFNVHSRQAPQAVLGHREMPGAQWFPGATVNYAEHVLRQERPGEIVASTLSELRPMTHVKWPDFAAEVRRLARALRAAGVQPGDRVAAYLPNVIEALAGLMASAAVGAVWSSCSPDFGVRSVIDRFAQIEPKVLLAVDGYSYGGKLFDRRDQVTELAAALPTLNTVVMLDYAFPGEAPVPPGAARWGDFVGAQSAEADGFEFEPTPFDHPLWILYSSGTTGLPKAIVHGHGGVTLEMLKLLSLHLNLGPGGCMFFHTTTGWVNWNIVASSPMTGARCVLYDGSPAHPTPDVLWRMAQDTGTTSFGASPTYVQMMSEAGIVPKDRYDLTALQGVTLGGAPATPEAMKWLYDNVGGDLWVTSQSGGTDIASAFIVGVPTQPVYAGEMQGAGLGVDLAAFDESGRPVVDEVGELVVRQPMPSMPLRFWNDPEGARYRDSYFSVWPDVWRHGDFLKVNGRGGCFVLGRSDSTLNRHGVRIGTAEIYRCVEALPEIRDSLVVNLERPGGDLFMPLFVTLAEGAVLDQNLTARITAKLRAECSPRHAPDAILAVPAIPYTLTGKKMEVPVRRILQGEAAHKVANRDAMQDPAALDAFMDLVGGPDFQTA